MGDNNLTIIQRTIEELPGWIFTIAGLAVLTGALLVPSWVSLQRVRWQLNIMQSQNTQLQKQLVQYTSFEKVLSENNPTVLKRLALVQLRKYPDDGKIIGPTHKFAFNVLPDNSKQNSNKAYKSFALASGSFFDSNSASVSKWLALPISKPTEAYKQPNTLLMRLTTGNSRWILLAAGLFCLIGGIYWRCNNKIV